MAMFEILAMKKTEWDFVGKRRFAFALSGILSAPGELDHRDRPTRPGPRRHGDRFRRRAGGEHGPGAEGGSRQGPGRLRGAGDRGRPDSAGGFGEGPEAAD